MDMTVLITCKNRHKNIKYCLASINNRVNVPKTLLIDFGSSPQLREIVYYPWLNIIRVDRNIETFHKARALNIGIKRIKTKFICITDADQIFSPNFFDVVYSKLLENERNFVMCKTFFLRDLPKSVTPDNIGKNYRNLLKIVTKKTNIPEKGDGCCNGVMTRWAKRVRGYDERYFGYGAEDSDFAFRAFVSGFKRVWIHKITTMIHLPHPKSGEYYKKELFLRNRKRYYVRKSKRDVIVNSSKTWGRL